MKNLIIGLCALGLVSACQEEPKQAIRHCVDKNGKVVEESKCEVVQAGGGSDGLHWLFLYMLLRPGQSAPSSGYLTSAPAAGFVTHRHEVDRVARMATPAPSPTPTKTSAGSGFTMPKSSSPVRSSPSYSSPSRSFSTPSSSARYR